MNTPAERPRDGFRSVLIVLVCIAALLAVVSGGVLGFLLLHSTKGPGDSAVPATLDVHPEAKDYSQADSVSIVLGEAGSEQGLMHLDQERDGTTMVHILEGVPTRTQSLTNERTTLNFYLQIDPTFKQADVRSVRVDVEYFSPYDGTIGIHYDALDLPALGNTDPEKRRYKDAGRKTLTASNVWRVATFYTREARFNNRQNGGADFRVWAKTPTIYLRRIKVTRAALPEDDWKTDYSQTNTVSLRMEEESPQDGVRHLSAEPDGRTTLTNLDGVVCRHMERLGRGNGFLYFTLSPSFKASGLTNARCEVEYFARRFVALRLQYDAVEFENHRPYKSATAEGVRMVNYGGANFTRLQSSNAWQTATFLLRDGVFMNSQNGGADMRLEVTPPDIFVRWVTISRESEPP